ncbi:hypothetical protein K504DRAFT_500940 [Pleomassaria siparia CBS 279.74]|uniref:HOOK N-terminal domain-containing protein n=1 Tax=Pleomassaria siparia CBS 279.74 TaxID=1314801 RepID=A0A6G1KEV7_9PLEO|nr:hypothetical protein K504DRAFT_500940 [Pleomassaria siparia CBS 279.74]
MDDFKPELLKALLDWVNTFQLPGHVSAYNQLEDGQLLWQILADIDSDYFSESLPNFDETPRRTSDNWIERWQNLKHIERSVSTYIREECEQLPVLTKRMIPDLKTGARDGSMMLTAKLTMAVCLAALFSPKSHQRMIEVMGSIDRTQAETIAAGVQEIQLLDNRLASLGIDQELTPEPHLSGYRTPNRAVSGAGSLLERDSGLEQEAQLFEANKDRASLKTQLNKAQADLETSRGRIAQLEEELVEARLHLDVREARGESSHDVEALRNDLTRDRQYIDQLETDLANAKDILESQKRRLDRLNAEEGSKQELRDQLQLIRAERDELNQKAKANENLKKKIHSLTQETKNLETLRQDYQQARERLQELESIEERCQALEKVNKENSQTLVNCEQSIFEEKGKRSRVEHENLLLMKQLEQTRELQYKADDARRELEDRIRELESSSQAGLGDSLEDELDQEENADNVDELQPPPPPSAKSLMEGRVGADSIALQQKVDVLNARLRSLELETLKQMQENLGLRSDVMNIKDEESQRPFLEQNQKLQTTEAELQELHRRLREKDLQMAELRNELNKKADVEEIARAESLQAEHDRLLALQQKTNSRLRELELSNDERLGLLSTALLDLNNLSPALLEIKRAETLKRVREQVHRIATAPSEAQSRIADTTASEIAETVLASQTALDIAKKVSHQHAPRNLTVSFDSLGSTLRPRSRLSASIYVPTMPSSVVFAASESSSYTKGKSSPEAPASSRSTGRTGWGAVSKMFGKKKRDSGVVTETMFTQSTFCVASPALGMIRAPLALHLSFSLSSPFSLFLSLLHLWSIPLAYQHLKQDLQAQMASTDALRSQLEKAKSESGEKGSIELQAEVENLRRENKLITSAWYDMTTRLQSNTVVLQRKSEAPKSWLGKQRAVVGGGGTSTRR